MSARWLELAAVVLTALWLAWLRWTARLRARPASPAPVADPYASQVAEFARQVSDWSRSG